MQKLLRKKELMPRLLSEEFPELAAQWDYERNGDLTPNKVTVGSNLIVWWKCDICGKSYQRKISNRTAPAKRKTESKKCPICLGRVIIPGYNSLKARYPEIVEKEWDYNRNNIDPDTIAPHTNKKVWWICPNGHSYNSLVNNKVLHNGGDCPYCSSQRLSREKSLGFVNPELSKEWHPTKNGHVTPFDIFASHNKKAWWLCSNCGHEWMAKVSNRNVGKRGCPKCANSRQSSVPEQLVYHSIRQFFPDAINRYLLGKDEIDVFIPSLNIGIEYDGGQFHNEKKLPKDIAKSKRIISKGITLYRFREETCPPLLIDSCIIISVKYSADYADLEIKLNQLISELKPEISTLKNIDFSKIINDIRASLDKVPYEQSFAAYIERKYNEGEQLIALWDYKKNAPLTPEMVMPFSEKIVSWICPTHPEHQWKNTVKSVSLGYGCKRCSKTYQYTTEEWIDEAIRVHGKKFQYHLVHYINSETKVRIICPKHGEFEQNPSEHLTGNGCPFCAHQQFHPLESLAALHPEIASQWDYEKNAHTGITPETIGIDTKKRFYWHCDKGCAHSYQATIAFRVNQKSGCAICHGKQVVPETSLGHLYPDLAKEWCKDNDKTPFEVSPGSEYMALWKCPNPNHEPYRSMVYSRAKLHTGCSYCSGNKKHPKDYEDELHDKHPNITILKPFRKTSERIECQCDVCKYIWNPLPYNLLKSKGCPKCKNKVKQDEVELVLSIPATLQRQGNDSFVSSNETKNETKELTERQMVILNLIKQDEKITNNVLTQKTGISQKTLRRELVALNKKGFITREAVAKMADG